jgi:hypothetical protein
MCLSYRVRSRAGDASIECRRVAPERRGDPWRFDVSRALFRVRARSRLGPLKLIEFTQATQGALFIPHMERK